MIAIIVSAIWGNYHIPVVLGSNRARAVNESAALQHALLIAAASWGTGVVLSFIPWP